MTGLIARDALWISLVVTALGLIIAPLGVWRKRRDWIQVAYGAVYANFLLVTVATGAMIFALVTHDFSIEYVAQQGSRNTPLFFTIISLWGALEGSILFWAWVLALYGAMVVWLHKKRPGDLIPYAASAMLLVSLFFAILLVGPANPFLPVFPVPIDGPGPNPLLQNHILMAVHPPLLYLGYVGMTVPFAFAAAAMLSGQVASDEWTRLAHSWMLASWGFLSAAIIAGMWWSYEVLGWGGYWAWDPVENASLLPWLTATAYLHSVILQQRRGMLKLWNLNLVVGTFILTIIGTFLTRSGILSSVHAFTTGTIGYYFLAFVGVLLVAAMAMVAGNSDKMRTVGQLDSVVSRDTVFLLNNLLLTALTFTVLIGTLYPLIAEAIRGVKVSVGEPFFNRMSVPMVLALLFLMGVGPALPWRSASAEELRRRLLPPVIGAVLLTIAALAGGIRNVPAILTFTFVGYASAANVREFLTGTLARRRNLGESPVRALTNLINSNRRRYGGYVAHIGIFVSALGVAASSALRVEDEATLLPGQTVSIAGAEVNLRDVWGREEPQRFVVGVTLGLLRGQDTLGVVEPRMNYYARSEQPVPTPAVRSSFTGDLYFNLMAFDENGANATVKVIVEPLVPWIWGGGGILMLGCLIAVLPARRRRGRFVAGPYTVEEQRATLDDTSESSTPELESAVDAHPELVGGKETTASGTGAHESEA